MLAFRKSCTYPLCACLSISRIRMNRIREHCFKAKWVNIWEAHRTVSATPSAWNKHLLDKIILHHVWIVTPSLHFNLCVWPFVSKAPSPSINSWALLYFPLHQSHCALHNRHSIKSVKWTNKIRKSFEKHTNCSLKSRTVCEKVF